MTISWGSRGQRGTGATPSSYDTASKHLQLTDALGDDCNYRAFSPLVIVGVASPTVVAMVTVFYIMKE